MYRRSIGFAALAALSLVASESALGTYDNNITGVVDAVNTYTDGLILIHLANQPSSHPLCNANFFAVDPGSTNDANAMNRMYARLITAYATQQPVNLGYDSQGDCVRGYIHVWRIG